MQRDVYVLDPTAGQKRAKYWMKKIKDQKKKKKQKIKTGRSKKKNKKKKKGKKEITGRNSARDEANNKPKDKQKVKIENWTNPALFSCFHISLGIQQHLQPAHVLEVAAGTRTNSEIQPKQRPLDNKYRQSTAT